MYFDQFLDINCSYIQPDDLKTDIFEKDLSELAIIHNNIRSLPLNFHKFEELFINSNKSPSIIAFTETKLTENSVIPAYHDYNFEHKNSSTAAGGVGVYLSNFLNYTVCNDISLNVPHCEDLWINVNLNTDNSKSNSKTINKLMIGVIYRHPNHNYHEFQEKLCDQLLLFKGLENP